MPAALHCVDVLTAASEKLQGSSCEPLETGTVKVKESVELWTFK